MNVKKDCNLTRGGPVLLALSMQAKNCSCSVHSDIERRIVRADARKYRKLKALHADAREMEFRVMLGTDAVEPNLIFFHRGVILPHSGIGQRIPNNCEQMFVVLDGEAEFTVDGRTSLINGPAGVPDRMGHTHGICNPTDKPVQWLNIKVGLKKGDDNFNLGDSIERQTLDSISQFVSLRLDRTLLKPVEAMNGGEGTVQYRRALRPTACFTTWSYIDHLVLPSGTSVGPRSTKYIAEVYYVMSGDGTMSLGQEKARIHNGDLIPVRLSESRSLANLGSEPLELLVVGVAKDMAAKDPIKIWCFPPMACTSP
jgi:mannose-6-phosphate isomerase-like protein (cupin superfamily)